jgi:beta-lactamase regulating signal transducer with metallopeptidase domain
MNAWEQASEIFRTLIIMSLSGSAIALLLFLAKPLLRDRLPKSIQYYLWLLVIAIYLIPISSLVTVNSFVPPFSKLVHATVITGYEYQEEAMITRVGHTSQLTDEELGQLSDDELVQTAMVIGETSQLKMLLNFVSLKLPLIGFFSVFFSISLQYWQYVRKLKRYNIPASVEEMTTLARICGSRVPLLWRNPLAATPMLIGVFQPEIILPDREFTDTQLRVILLHELTHLRRQDVLVKWLSVFACAVHWFNPIVWLTRREIDRACELSCDETVIAGLGTVGRQTYGDTLIYVAAATKTPMAVLTTTMCEEKKDLKERLGAIMKSRKHTRAVIVMSAVLLVLVGFGAVLLGAGYESAGTEETVYISKKFDFTNAVLVVSLPETIEMERNVIIDSVDAGSFWTDDLLPELRSGNAMAIYQGKMVGSLTGWLMDKDFFTDGSRAYTIVKQDENSGVAVTLVYYREDYLARGDSQGFAGIDVDMSHYGSFTDDDQYDIDSSDEFRESFYKKGIMAYNIPLKIYVTLEFNWDAVSDEELLAIANSLNLNPPPLSAVLSSWVPLADLPADYSQDAAIGDNVYVNIHGLEIYNQQLVDAFYDNVSTDSAAFMRTILYTIEGDPIITDYQYDGEVFTVTIDTTRDKFGTPEITIATYKYLVPLYRSHPVGSLQQYFLSNEQTINTTNPTNPTNPTGEGAMLIDGLGMIPSPSDG